MLENGAILIPAAELSTYMVNPNAKTVIRTSRLFLPDAYICVFDDFFIKFHGGEDYAEVINLGDDHGYTIDLAIEAPKFNTDAVISRNGFAYFYSTDLGLCAYAKDGSAYIMIDLNHMKSKDYLGLPSSSIVTMDVSANDWVAFYDNWQKCIRLIRHAQ